MAPSDLHVAVIMDGNGRWARRRGLPRSAGHREGTKAVRRTVEAAPSHGISVLTLYAFSSDNWGRPKAEVDTLMGLFEHYLDEETHRCIEEGVRLNVIGRRDRVPAGVRRAIERAERATADGRRLLLRIAVDYSSRWAIRQAAALPGGSFSQRLAAAIHARPAVRDVDLMIRTSGEQRLSDFLLWECAYAELYFTEQLWPDFGAEHLATALAAFGGRQRRFGRLPPEPAPALQIPAAS